MSGIVLRSEAPGDAAEVDALLAEAFGQRGEADLVERLRGDGGLALSSVAVCDGRLAAFAAASPMHRCDGAATGPVLALAPVAVASPLQNRGLGKAVTGAAIDAARQTGALCLTVLGDPAYYGRFGFEPASRHGMTVEAGDFGDAFMALVFLPSQELRGVFRWHAAFDPLLAGEG
jgi:putative acetyltransferase